MELLFTAGFIYLGGLCTPSTESNKGCVQWWGRGVMTTLLRSYLQTQLSISFGCRIHEIYYPHGSSVIQHSEEHLPI